MRHHWGIDALHLNLRRGNFSILLTTFGSATLIHSLSSIGKLPLKPRFVIDLASSQLCNGALPLPPPECPSHQTRNFVRRLGQFAVVVKGRHDKRLPGSTVTLLWRCGTETFFYSPPRAAKKSALSIRKKPLGFSLTTLKNCSSNSQQFLFQIIRLSRGTFS